MWKLIRGVTRDIKDPKSGQTVYQQWQAHAKDDEPDAEAG